MDRTERRLTPEEEITLDTKIESIKSWLIKCPKECPVSDLFEIVVMLQNDRKTLLHERDIIENKFYG